mgnify:CR=1 FL=1
MVSDMRATRQHRSVVAVVLLVSSAGLVFEIALTRLFSLFFQYHYAFLAVSLAVLGISLGAAGGQLLAPARSDSVFFRRLLGVLIALSLAFSLAAMGIAWLPTASSVLPRALIALVPFVLLGLFAALVFERLSHISGLLYGADLIGAALGVGLVLWLLSLSSAFTIVLLLGALIGAAALALVYFTASSGPDRRYLIGAGVACVAGLALLVINLAWSSVDFDPARLKDAPRDKTMLTILNDPAQDARIVRTAWSPLARVDVVETNDAGARFVFADGGAGSYMIRYDGDLASVEYLKNSIEYLPFAVSATEDTLILGAGAGKDVLLALLADAKTITAVEINPAIVNVTREYASYNGHIFDLPQVELVESDARLFVERSERQFDLIYLNLVYTQAAGASSQPLVENYVFTWQAFEAYFKRLKPGGQLAIVTHNALEGSRAALSALKAFDQMGIPPTQALDHLVIWMYPAPDPTQRMSVLLIGKQPLSDETLEQLKEVAQQQGMRPLYYPRVNELVFMPLRNGTSLDDFVNVDAEYDLSPTSDDRPYFFHLDFGLPRPIQSALITTAIFAGGLFVAGLLLVAPGKEEGGLPSWIVMITYAALIGTGFMLVEVSLIQRFQLLLGYPVLALAAVLGTLLLAGGVGSLISQRWRLTSLRSRVSLIALWIGALALVYRFTLPPITREALDAPVAARLGVVMALVALLGIPMGIPFASLLRLAGQYRQRVALLWAINGAFSVLGSALAVVLSMTSGFSWALTGGAVLYLLLAGFLQARVKLVHDRP